jgi:hypothetical protein
MSRSAVLGFKQVQPNKGSMTGISNEIYKKKNNPAPKIAQMLNSVMCFRQQQKIIITSVRIENEMEEMVSAKISFHTQ